LKRLRFILIATVVATAAHADPLVGTLYYTTFSGTVNVHKVDYAYDGSAIIYSNNNGIASTNGADGILFAPDGNLLVAGQANNIVSEITPTGTPVGTVDAGTGSYHLALSSDDSNATLYNIWNGSCACGQISALTLVGGGIVGSATGVVYTVSGSDSNGLRGLVYDPANGTWYYGTAPDNGSGDFGTVTFSGTTATLTPIASGQFAHGLTYDPYTNTIIFSSANTLGQYDPSTNTFHTFSSIAGEFDQSAVDGKGHLFVASNTGSIVFMDYSTSGLIDAPSFTDSQFLATDLDDIAPLSGAGANIPEPGTLLLIGGAMIGLGQYGRKKRKA
jgi:streptogramin lyase